MKRWIAGMCLGIFACVLCAICIGAPDSSATGDESKETKVVEPPPPAEEVEIPAIPEVDEDPFSPGAGPPKDERPRLLPEGRRLVNREGRVVRQSDGRLVLVLDSGDEPIALSPNKLRERVEEMTDYGAKTIRFRISGVISEYRDKNYILLSKVVKIPETEVEL